MPAGSKVMAIPAPYGRSTSRTGGSIKSPAVKRVSARVEEQLGFAEMPVVHFAELYARKIITALDRQHPRDLFDIRDLRGNEGIDDMLRKAFIVYLLSQ